MEVKTLAQLSKIADVCRKKGIESIKITTEAVEFTLKEDLPTRKRSKKPGSIADNTEHGIDQSEMPSQEDILFWSAGGIEAPTTGQE